MAAGTYAFRRTAPGAPDIVVAFNLGSESHTLSLAADDVLLATDGGVALAAGGLKLPPLSGA